MGAVVGAATPDGRGWGARGGRPAGAGPVPITGSLVRSCGMGTQMPRCMLPPLGSVLLLSVSLWQCQGGAAPPGETPGAASAAPSAPAPVPSELSPTPEVSTPSDGGPGVDPAAPPASSATRTTSAAPPPPTSATPALVGPAGEPLPQTDERPTTKSAFFQRIGPALFEAIVRDDPDHAKPFFFPLPAYQQVKAIERPERDWRGRLVRLFERDIHNYHQHLGRYRDQAQYVDFEVPEASARFMKPHTEGNRLPYWRVLRSHLIYRDHQGRRLRLEVTSLISWRGEWYVVHLNGFK